MKLNQNKKDEILQLDGCSKNLLLWIQLQALQEDKIEITYSLYSKDIKVSLNTFKKSLGGLLDSRILYATSSKGWYSLNKDFIAYSDHNGLGDFKQYSKEFLEEAKKEYDEWLNSESYKRYKEESGKLERENLNDRIVEETVFVVNSKKDKEKIDKLRSLNQDKFTESLKK